MAYLKINLLVLKCKKMFSFDIGLKNILGSRERCRRELKLLAAPPKPVRSRMREEAKNNPRRRELR
jgi:hypothetical protein